jgi:hypothetical protein
MPRVRTALAVLLVACLWPRPAGAGRTFYGWLYGTEVMPERSVELQTWILDESGKYGPSTKETWLWWGPLIGVTDQLELALPIELEWASIDVNDVVKTSFTFKRFGIEARYRLAPQDPAEAKGLVPLVRLAVKRDVIVRDSLRLEGDAVMSYDLGPVNALVDIGVIADVAASTRHSELRPGGGISVQVATGLRFGAEAYSELSLDTRGESWAVVGPNIAWSHGRFWLSAAFGIGVYHVRTAPRVMWGVAF